MSNAYCLLPLASGLGLGMPPTGPQRTRRSSAPTCHDMPSCLAPHRMALASLPRYRCYGHLSTGHQHTGILPP